MVIISTALYICASWNGSVGMLSLKKEAVLALRMLGDSGYEAYIIGGCVRDYLMGREPGDIDITTSARPEEIKEVFRCFRVIENGIKHGTVTVIINEVPLEITTYRIDGIYSDSRHPDKVSFTKSLREDAARRDFTINAIACGLDGHIVDYFGGAQDIQNRTIRAVGDPEVRFQEDALRILRALRFSSTLGFEIEDRTKAAVFKYRELLNHISSERIASELIKLLCGINAGKVIKEYIEVLGVFIPELMPMRGFDQKNPHHNLDLLSHTCLVVDSIEKKPVLRLAALLHDIGKIETFITDDKGIGHFYGHESAGAELAEKMLKRLKLDRQTIENAVSLIKHHGMFIEESERSVKRALGRLSPDTFFYLIKLKRADSMAQNSAQNILEHCNEIERIAVTIIERGECFSKHNLAINGNDLIKLGMRQGREIGMILDELLDMVIDGRLENKKQALEEYAEHIINIEKSKR